MCCILGPSLTRIFSISCDKCKAHQCSSHSVMHTILCHFESDHRRIWAKFVNALLHAYTLAFGLTVRGRDFLAMPFSYSFTLSVLHQCSERCSTHVIDGITRPWTVDDERPRERHRYKIVAHISIIVMLSLQIESKVKASTMHASYLHRRLLVDRLCSSVLRWRQWCIKRKILLFLLNSVAKLVVVQSESELLHAVL